MKVLVTGASGFLGSYALATLRQHGVETVAIGRRRPSAWPEVDFIEADLLATLDHGAILRQSAATHLLHLAWYAEHGAYWTSPLNLRWTEATIRLVEAFCAAGGQQVVVAGTCAEYDWSYGYCCEDRTPLVPMTLYGIAKDSSRRLVMAICASYRVPCAWARVFLPYGKGEANQRLIPSLIEVFQGKRTPFGVNASAYRDFLHASDVATGFYTLLKRCADGAYNLGSGEPVRVGELVRNLAKLANANPQVVLERGADRPDDPPFVVGDNRKLLALGWTPTISLSEGLEMLVREAHQ